MSTTFSPYASVVMATLIKANEEIIMNKHHKEHNHTYGQKELLVI